MITKTDLNKLTKEELKDLSYNLLRWHERHYDSVKEHKESLDSAFYQLAGNIISLRRNFKLPELDKQ